MCVTHSTDPVAQNPRMGNALEVSTHGRVCLPAAVTLHESLEHAEPLFSHYIRKGLESIDDS